jgi:hypothetical protein
MCYCSTEMKGAPADVIRTLALTITSRHTPRFLALLDYRKLIARNHSKVDIVCDVADPNSNRTPRLLLGEIARNERLGGTEGVCLSSDRCGSFNNTPISIG